MRDHVPAALTIAVGALWQLPAPGPPNLLRAPAFVHLCDTCLSLYPSVKSKGALGFALSNALQGLGLPCTLAPANAGLAQPPEVIAAELHAAFRRTQASRLHLCPLDMGDDLPALTFG